MMVHFITAITDLLYFFRISEIRTINTKSKENFISNNLERLILCCLSNMNYYNKDYHPTIHIRQMMQFIY